MAYSPEELKRRMDMSSEANAKYEPGYYESPKGKQATAKAMLDAIMKMINTSEIPPGVTNNPTLRDMAQEVRNNPASLAGVPLKRLSELLDKEVRGTKLRNIIPGKAPRRKV